MAWLKQQNFAGAFVWTLDFDDFGGICASKKFPIINAVKQGLQI